MLALARRVVMLDGSVKRGAWGIREGYEGFELRGKRLGVIGLGAIGRRVAEIGASLGMNVTYWSRTSRDSKLPLLELDELVSTADVIQICVALTPDTHGLIGIDQFARMKRGVLMINTAQPKSSITRRCSQRSLRASSAVIECPRWNRCSQVGNHSGGGATPDTFVFLLAYNTYFTVEGRPLYALAHDTITAAPGIGGELRRRLRRADIHQRRLDAFLSRW